MLPAILFIGVPGKGGRGKGKNVKGKTTAAASNSGATDQEEDNLFTYRHNYDVTYKLFMSKFPDTASKQFMSDNSRIGDSLSFELPSVSVKKTISDSFNHILDEHGNKTNGVLHGEMETNVDLEDMYRFHKTELKFNFAHFHDGLRIAKRIIITKEITKDAIRYLNEYAPEDKPVIINLCDLDANIAISKATDALDKGTAVNEFDLIFSPLYKSTDTPVEVLRKVCQMVTDSNREPEWKNNILSLIILVSNKVVPTEELAGIKKEMVDMGATIAEYIYEEGATDGEARRSRETAVAGIKKGMVDSDISELSFLPITEVAEIRAELGIPAPPEEIPLESRELAIHFIKDGCDDSFISKYSHLSIEKVAKIRAEIGIPAPSKNNVIPLESSIDPLLKAITFIKYGMDDSLVSKYSLLSIEDVAKIRAEIEADPKTK
ncbi:MAG: hypothetical protein LBC41_18105 [Clostridiales bacterium]|nr:hypothetical protein [Clostridiales bacterium]